MDLLEDYSIKCIKTKMFDFSHIDVATITVTL